MALVWVAARRTYRDTDTGDLLEQEELVALRNAYAVATGADVDRLVDDFLAGAGDLDVFSLAFQELITHMMTTGYLFGRGGVEQMQEADWDTLAEQIEQQLDYARRFREDLQFGDVSDEQLRARAKLYTGASVRMYEAGHAAAFGPTMPAYPGDTECKSNCRCTWIIVDAGDAWECTWKLEPGGDHCDDCLGNNRQWAPYVVMKGTSQ